MKTYHRVLTIAGSDSGGGAGIQADLKTFCTLKCYGASVITALTAQNTQGVQAQLPIAPEFIATQLKSVLTDIGADAIKIGMLASKEIIKTVAENLPPNIPIVLDPVMVAKDGSKLLNADATEALKEYLIPRATLLTPNLPEAEVLLGRPIKTFTDMAVAAADLSTMGTHILLKGGHLTSDEIGDCLYLKDSAPIWFYNTKIQTQNTHGTGCTLSAAIAAYLARGENITNAVKCGLQYLSRALNEGANFKLGAGFGPVKHHE